VAILVVILAPKGLVGLWRAALEHLEHDRGPKPVSQTLRVEQ